MCIYYIYIILIYKERERGKRDHKGAKQRTSCGTVERVGNRPTARLGRFRHQHSNVPQHQPNKNMRTILRSILYTYIYILDHFELRSTSNLKPLFRIKCCFLMPHKIKMSAALSAPHLSQIATIAGLALIAIMAKVGGTPDNCPSESFASVPSPNRMETVSGLISTISVLFN